MLNFVIKGMSTTIASMGAFRFKAQARVLKQIIKSGRAVRKDARANAPKARKTYYFGRGSKKRKATPGDLRKPGRINIFINKKDFRVVVTFKGKLGWYGKFPELGSAFNQAKPFLGPAWHKEKPHLIAGVKSAIRGAV